jgi:hypothetical protein
MAGLFLQTPSATLEGLFLQTPSESAVGVSGNETNNATSPRYRRRKRPRVSFEQPSSTSSSASSVISSSSFTTPVTLHPLLLLPSSRCRRLLHYLHSLPVGVFSVIHHLVVIYPRLHTRHPSSVVIVAVFTMSSSSSSLTSPPAVPSSHYSSLRVSLSSLTSRRSATRLFTHTCRSSCSTR